MKAIRVHKAVAKEMATLDVELKRRLADALALLLPKENLWGCL
jgi:hypothetical protein